MPSDVVALGYTCICGEQVVVFHMVVGRKNHAPPARTVSCSQGHVARFTPAQVSALEPLVQPGDESAARNAA